MSDRLVSFSLRLAWRGLGRHNHHLITPSDMEAWCAATGYTEPFHQEGRWWAFPPGGVIPVEVSQQVRGWLRDCEQPPTDSPIDSLISRLGLMPFEQVAPRIREGNRQTGRTTKAMLEALQIALNGEIAAFIVHNQQMMKYVLGVFCNYLDRLDVESHVVKDCRGVKINLPEHNTHILVATLTSYPNRVQEWQEFVIFDHLALGVY